MIVSKTTKMIAPDTMFAPNQPAIMMMNIKTNRDRNNHFSG